MNSYYIMNHVLHNEQLDIDEIPCLESTGSCGLHTLSNALQNGAKKSVAN